MDSEINSFFKNLKDGKISEEKKRLLYDLVINLDNATELQKERFILVYNLQSIPNIKYNISNIARKQNCSPSAVKYSIGRIRNYLINLKSEKKDIFREIVKKR